MNIGTLLNWKISLFSLFLWFVWVNFPSYQTIAQLIPDDTLGDENSLVTPQDVRDLIEGGAIRGDNLFHSFLEFNINDGQRVDFGNPTGIVNIFTRVTGANPSDIFGTLGVDGAANLILINPNGINLGANAVLDVRGSFFATTADSLVFDNGWEFSATNPEAPPLLTINIPLGLQYGSNPGNINVNQSILEVEQGQSLSLMGGNIQVEGGQLNVPGGRVELGAITGAGYVGINSDGSFSFPEGVARGDINLTNETVIKTSIPANTQGNAGVININAQNIYLTASQLLASLEEGATGNAGRIAINADIIKLNNYETTPSVIEASVIGLNEPNPDTPGVGGASGNGGTIAINVDSFLEIKGSVLDVSVGHNGSGSAGNVLIDAGDNGFIDLKGVIVEDNNLNLDTRISANVGDYAQASTGIIEIIADTLIVDRGTSTSSQGAGIEAVLGIRSLATQDGGDIIIQANSIQGFGNIAIQSTISEGAQGKAGDINITTSELLLIGNSKIQTNLERAFSLGDANVQMPTIGEAGDINVNANTITLNSSARISASLGQESEGEAGNINITTNILELTEGGLIISETDGIGDAGDISIEASEYVMVDGFLERDPPITFVDGNGQAGARVLASRIETSTALDGKGGDITINTPDLQVLNGGNINSSTGGTVGSDGGTIIINADKVELRDGGQLFVDARNNVGDSGSIILNVSDSLNIQGSDPNRTRVTQAIVTRLQEGIDNGEDGFTEDLNLPLIAQRAFRSFDPESGIYSNSQETSQGNAGNIIINSESILIAESGQVNVSSLGMGEGGEISIFADTMTLDNGQITAETNNADGGNINLAIANLLSLGNESLISATARNQADGGNITIDAGFLVAFPPEGLNGSDIQANADKGNGGTVNIAANGIYGLEFRAVPTPDNDITVTSLEGSAGVVELNTPDTNPAEGLDSLSEIIASPPPLKGCQTKEGQSDDSIVTTRHRGFPTNPYELLSDNYIWEDVEFPSQLAASLNNTEKTEGIVEAQGWIINDQGNVELVANLDNGSSQVSCGFH